MKIIVGLGNPGIEYQSTRHNSGVMLVDKLAEGLSSNYGWRKNYDAMVYKTPEVVLVKTKDVFMNESGRLLQGLQEGELWVAHDDLDLKLGEYKVQFGKGPKLHNGMESVENALKTKDFWRIRIGIDNRATPIEGETYVLQKFSPEEKVILERVLEEITNEVYKTNT
jgi:PTH1 family peptidyl-tRNA hydrolase